jgi:hypothetical protein
LLQQGGQRQILPVEIDRIDNDSFAGIDQPWSANPNSG